MRHVFRSPRWAALLILSLVLALPGALAKAETPTTLPTTVPAAAAAATAEPAKLAGDGPVDIDANTDKVNSGSTAWLLTSSALVLMMTAPGLALFYSGLVRKKNVLATMMQSFILMAVVTVIWALIGYSLAFSEGNSFIGGLRFAFMNEVEANPASTYAVAIPHTTWMVYQCMFAIITPALICGAYAERMKFSSMLVFSVLWLLVIYCPLAHMVWGKGGLFNWALPSKLNIPALDFAGGTVVHISSGISALVCAIVLGKRVGYGRTPMPPHSVVISVIGAGLLWVGWFGFNGGSALEANGLASSAFINTHFAAASATLGWVLIEWLKTGKPTVLGAISGAVAGLVVITPAAGFVNPMSALAMGAIGGVVCFFGATMLKHKLGYDDSLDAFGVHGVGGMLGAVLTGVFATSKINSLIKSADGTTNLEGLIYGNKAQLFNQIYAVAITVVIAAVGSFIILKIVDAVMGLRVSTNDEEEGLDITQHGESGYNFEEEFGGTVLDESAASAKA